MSQLRVRVLQYATASTKALGGINGTFPAVSRSQLHRYLSEFELRHGTRGRSGGAYGASDPGWDGKRFTYKEQIAKVGGPGLVRGLAREAIVLILSGDTPSRSRDLRRS